jgi:hypothetical protein
MPQVSEGSEIELQIKDCTNRYVLFWLQNVKKSVRTLILK